MFFLTINAGSSSIKMEFFLHEKNSNLAPQSLLYLEVEALGLAHQKLEAEARVQEKAWLQRAESLKALPLPQDFTGILEAIFALVQTWGLPFTSVHRMVHSGFLSERIVKVESMEQVFELEKLMDFAPLHHPANLAGLQLTKKIFPKQELWVVFDTFFHATLPERSTRYAIPEFWENLGLRRYGFHGSSFAFLAESMRERGIHNFIACHMGNGISLCAIEKGKSIETSMGFSPMEGPLMGTRSGSVDDGIIFYLLKKGYKLEEIERVLLKESGLLALSKLSSDVRILKAERQKSQSADFALTYLCYQMSRHIASLLPCFSTKPEAIVFTGGIGCHAEDLRAEIMAPLAFLGLPVYAMESKENLQMVREVLRKKL